MNLLKLIVLSMLPVALIATAAWAEMPEEVIFFGGLLMLTFCAGLYWFCDKIALKGCRAELITPYHNPALFRTVEELSRQGGIPTPKIYLVDEEAPNVCSVGRSRHSAGLVFTDGMLESLDQQQIRCAIAHELTHIYRGDTLMGCLGATFASLLGMSSRIAREAVSAQQRRSTLGKYALRGMVFALASFAALVIRVLVDRKREFRADEAGAKLTAQPLAMANAIRTMEKRNHATPLNIAPAVSHLFMVHPLALGRIGNLFVTHPSFVERVDRLEALRQHRSGERVSSAGS